MSEASFFVMQHIKDLYKFSSMLCESYYHKRLETRAVPRSKKKRWMSLDAPKYCVSFVLRLQQWDAYYFFEKNKVFHQVHKDNIFYY